MDFVRHINDYLNAFVRHADVKASVVFFISVAMLGYLAQNVGPPQFLDFTVRKAVLFSLAVLSDVCALVTGLWIVFPRLPRSSRQGLIFWEDITIFKDDQEYAGAISTISDQQQIEALAKQNYALATIAQAKYRKLQWAVIFAGTGALLTFLFVILY